MCSCDKDSEINNEIMNLAFAIKRDKFKKNHYHTILVVYCFLSTT